MKNFLSILLVLSMTLCLIGCGGKNAEETTDPNAGKFLAGFGSFDISPLESVPLASYGDSSQRMSDGIKAKLEALALAITDEEGQSMIFIVGDMSWCPQNLGTTIKSKLTNGVAVTKINIPCIYTSISLSKISFVQI